MSSVKQGVRSGGGKVNPGSQRTGRAGSRSSRGANSRPASGSGRGSSGPVRRKKSTPSGVSRNITNPSGGSASPGRPFRPIRRSGGGYARPPRRKRGGFGGLLLAAIILVLLVYGMRSRLGDGNASDFQPSFMVTTTKPQNTPPTETSPLDPDNSDTPDGISSLPADSAIEVQVLDVGQGLSVLLTCGDETLLYDGGDRKTSSFLVAYLQKQGLETLDYVVVSHYDSDHLAGIIGVLNVFDVETLIAPSYESDTRLFSSFEQAVLEHDIAITSPAPGDTYTLGAGSFQILAPEDTEYENENDYSIVLRVSLGDSSLLLTGDATQFSEKEMLESGLPLQSDVLLAGHHGSAGSTSEAFLEAVSPDYVVISCGQGNSYGHPAGRVMELLETEAVPIYRTDLQGTVGFTMNAREVTFEQQPCADYTSGEELILSMIRAWAIPGTLFPSLKLVLLSNAPVGINSTFFQLFSSSCFRM